MRGEEEGGAAGEGRKRRKGREGKGRGRQPGPRSAPIPAPRAGGARGGQRGRNKGRGASHRLRPVSLFFFLAPGPWALPEMAPCAHVWRQRHKRGGGGAGRSLGAGSCGASAPAVSAARPAACSAGRCLGSRRATRVRRGEAGPVLLAAGPNNAARCWALRAAPGRCEQEEAAGCRRGPGAAQRPARPLLGPCGSGAWAQLLARKGRTQRWMVACCVCFCALQCKGT